MTMTSVDKKFGGLLGLIWRPTQPWEWTFCGCRVSVDTHVHLPWHIQQATLVSNIQRTNRRGVASITLMLKMSTLSQ